MADSESPNHPIAHQSKIARVGTGAGSREPPATVPKGRIKDADDDPKMMPADSEPSQHLSQDSHLDVPKRNPKGTQMQCASCYLQCSSKSFAKHRRNCKRNPGSDQYCSELPPIRDTSGVLLPKNGTCKKDLTCKYCEKVYTRQSYLKSHNNCG